jgi:E3 ubiquitin-protein ligase MARCH6
VIYHWIEIGIVNLFNIFKRNFIIGIRITVLISLLFGIIPLLFGILFQLCIINPISCNHDQTPVMSLWQVWALGVLHTKITTALILTGPQWWLKQSIDRVCQNGLRNMNLKFTILELFLPVVKFFGFALAFPYVLSKTVAPLLSNSNLFLFYYILILFNFIVAFVVNDAMILHLLHRRIYPISLFMSSFIFIIVFQVRQFKSLYERIRNDK